MNKSKVLFQWFSALIMLAILHVCTAKGLNLMPQQSYNLNHLLNKLAEYRQQQQQQHNTIVVLVLSFIVAFVCSAAGVGGGPLFLPILNLVGGIELKTASSYSAFMVTGVLLSNVLYYLFFGERKDSTGKSLINYDMALLSEPCLLLGVSFGVICNVTFPEWLVILLFIIFLAYSTQKTWNTGIRLWRSETNGFLSRSIRIESSEVLAGDHHNSSVFDSLLNERLRPPQSSIPWNDLLVLVVFWVCFFVLQVFKDDEDLAHVKPCGIAYWLITFSQIPLAIAFTAYILYRTRIESHNVVVSVDTMPVIAFPSAALVTGVLSGLFGIGGGLLLNPLLLQIGLPPQSAAATSTFMLFFSTSMSTVQYIILGMTGIKQACICGLVCFSGSAIGLSIVQKAIKSSGRASVIVFSITGVMALSLIVMGFGGAIDVWKQYTSGEYMGFKTPC